MVYGIDESYWMATTAPTSYPSLTADAGSDIEADVAVIGAGIAGICTAWEVAQAGRRVMLLEADRIVAATTGYTTAKLTAQHGLIYERLRSTLGAETAALYASAQSDAINRVAELTSSHAIDCDLERRSAYTYVTDDGGLDEVRAEVAAATAAGLPAALVTDTGLPFRVAGAIRVDDQAQFHPRRFLLALAERLVAAGCSIFEGTRVVDMAEGRPCRVTTESGVTVRARDVVIATQYPIFDRAALFTRLAPRRELVVAAPIPASADPNGSI